MLGGDDTGRDEKQNPGIHSDQVKTSKDVSEIKSEELRLERFFLKVSKSLPFHRRENMSKAESNMPNTINNWRQETSSQHDCARQVSISQLPSVLEHTTRHPQQCPIPSNEPGNLPSPLFFRLLAGCNLSHEIPIFPKTKGRHDFEKGDHMYWHPIQF